MPVVMRQDCRDLHSLEINYWVANLKISVRPTAVHRVWFHYHELDDKNTTSSFFTLIIGPKIKSFICSSLCHVFLFGLKTPLITLVTPSLMYPKKWISGPVGPSINRSDEVSTVHAVTKFSIVHFIISDQNSIWGFIPCRPPLHGGELAYKSHKLQHRLTPTRYSSDQDLADSCCSDARETERPHNTSPLYDKQRWWWWWWHSHNSSTSNPPPTHPSPHCSVCVGEKRLRDFEIPSVCLVKQPVLLPKLVRDSLISL